MVINILMQVRLHEVNQRSMISVNDRGIVGMLAEVVILNTKLNKGTELFLVCWVKLLSSGKGKRVVYDRYLNELRVIGRAAEDFCR